MQIFQNLDACCLSVHYPKLRNITHTLSLGAFVAFKGTKFYILFVINAAGAF